MSKKQELKELLERLKKWKKGLVALEDSDGIEFNDIINEFESFIAPAGDENGSNPPGAGPGTPP
jgi:hypothetical protein